MTGAIKSMGSRMANCPKRNENNQFNRPHPLRAISFPSPGLFRKSEWLLLPILFNLDDKAFSDSFVKRL